MVSRFERYDYQLFFYWTATDRVTIYDIICGCHRVGENGRDLLQLFMCAYILCKVKCNHSCGAQ